MLFLKDFKVNVNIMYCRSQNKVEQEIMLVSKVKQIINDFTLLLKFSNTVIVKRKFKDL